jgi:hypothetical protein
MKNRDGEMGAEKTARVCFEGHPMTNAWRSVGAGNGLHKISFSLRAGKFAAAAILVLAVGIVGNAVVLRWRATGTNSRDCRPATSPYPLSVGESDSTTPLSIQSTSAKIVHVEDLIVSVVDRIADGFKVSSRGDGSDRLYRIHRIGRIERVSRLDRIYLTSGRSAFRVSNGGSSNRPRF